MKCSSPQKSFTAQSRDTHKKRATNTVGIHATDRVIGNKGNRGRIDSCYPTNVSYSTHYGLSLRHQTISPFYEVCTRRGERGRGGGGDHVRMHAYSAVGNSSLQLKSKAWCRTQEDIWKESLNKNGTRMAECRPPPRPNKLYIAMPQVTWILLFPTGSVTRTLSLSLLWSTLRLYCLTLNRQMNHMITN